MEKYEINGGLNMGVSWVIEIAPKSSMLETGIFPKIKHPFWANLWIPPYGLIMF